ADIALQKQEEHREGIAKEGMIREFVERPVPPGCEKREISSRRFYWSGEFERQESEVVQRDRICAAEVWVECFGGDVKYMKRAESVEINAILAAMPGWRRHPAAMRFGPYGVQKGFVRL